MNNTELLNFMAKNPNFQDSPFFQQLCDEKNTFDLVMGGESKRMNRAIWNLIITKRDLTMYHKFGMKPTSHWKVGDVKRYFGLKGNINTLMPKYEELCEIILGTQPQD